jgi:hypothetical protein
MGSVSPRGDDILPRAVALLWAHQKVCREELKSAIVKVSGTLPTIAGRESTEHQPTRAVKAAQMHLLGYWFQPIRQERNHDKGQLTWRTPPI